MSARPTRAPPGTVDSYGGVVDLCFVLVSSSDGPSPPLARLARSSEEGFGDLGGYGGEMKELLNSAVTTAQGTIGACGYFVAPSPVCCLSHSPPPSCTDRNNAALWSALDQQVRRMRWRGRSLVS